MRIAKSELRLFNEISYEWSDRGGWIMWECRVLHLWILRDVKKVKISQELNDMNKNEICQAFCDKNNVKLDWRQH